MKKDWVVSFDDDMCKLLDEMAKREGRSRKHVLIEAIMFYDHIFRRVHESGGALQPALFDQAKAAVTIVQIIDESKELN